MADPNSYIRQASALPVRGGKVCLVTSSNGKRWVIPKGLIEPGQTAGEAALMEAWEEAGLSGALQQEPIGSYVYQKYNAPCLVTVVLMEVTQVEQNWPERSLRQRTWVSPAELLDRISDPALADLLRAALERHLVEPERVGT